MSRCWCAWLPLFAASVGGCDSFFVANPNNCVVTPSSCDGRSICNPDTTHCEPNFILGQPDAETVMNLKWGLRNPSGVLLVKDLNAGNQVKLMVADTGNSRVLIWNQVPRTPQDRRLPDVLLGQLDFTTTVGNYGGLGVKTIASPQSVASDGRKLLVGDAGNSRVLIWNVIPQASGTAPDALWGQSNFVTVVRNAAIAANNVLDVQLSVTGGGLFLTDTGNKRTMMFSGIPSGPSDAPMFVFGPSDFVSKASGTFTPTGIPWSDGTSLYVTDSGTDRLVKFPFPTATSTSVAIATVPGGNLYGTVCANGAVASNCFRNPSGVAVSSDCNGTGCIWMVDQSNNRVVRYSIPTVPVPFQFVLGQPNAAAYLPKAPPDIASLNTPTGVSVVDGQMAIADAGNHRILLWNSIPTTSGQPADVVIGQPDGQTGDANAPEQIAPLRFSSPSAVTGDQSHLVVADTALHRVLIWNHIPTTTDTPPDVVLGQTDFGHGSINGGSAFPTAQGLASPISVHVEDGHLAVADQDNHRVLIWNQIPTQHNTPADIVIGQVDFQSNVPGAAPATTAASLNAPGGVHLSRGRLFVADSGCHRVLRYNSPYQSGVSIAADVVIGQPGLTGNVANAGGISGATLKNPTAVAVDGERLAISDTGNFRVLIWNQVPSAHGVSADRALGQSDLNLGNSPPGVNPSVFNAPAGVLWTDIGLVVADRSYNRVLYFRNIPSVNGGAADGVLGQTDTRVAIQNNHTLSPIERLSGPSSVFQVGERWFIADTGNSRIVGVRRP